MLDLTILRATFRYCPRLGRLYRGRELVKGTPKYVGGPLVVWHQGRHHKYARICFVLARGYEPQQVRHRNGKDCDNQLENLYDPAVGTRSGAKYPGVYSVQCQKTGRHRGYRGVVTFKRKRLYTAVVETVEGAAQLRKDLQQEVADNGEYPVENLENGKFRGFFRHKGVTYHTPTVENPTMARDLCVMLKVQVELQH